ncbi:MAG: glycosyltransferase [Candidatus Promineofilum sp.]|nr:glycosyltransferase [Promineifilum sp.]
MRILFLTARLPYPPTRGDRLRAYHFLRVLSQEHRITLLSFIGDESEAGNVNPLRPFCEDIQLVHRAPWQSALGAATGAWRPLPLQALYYRSPIMRGAVDRLLARGQFDAVYVHLFRMAQYVSHRFHPYRILDLTDAISGEVARSLPYRDPLWRLIYRLELPRIRRYERQMVGHFDETWLISEVEREAVAAAVGAGVAGDGRPPPNLRVVPNGVETERYRPQVRPVSQPALIFVGHMGVFHNIDAAERLAEVILPRVRETLPTARLDLIGAEPAARVRALDGRPGVRVLGHVADLNAALNEATVFVAPLRFAAGVQNKVLEAMAAGLPVVTTAEVNAGLRATPGEHLLLAEDDDALVAVTTTLLGDAAERSRLGQAGRAFVRENFRWEAVGERLREIEARLQA